MYKLYKWPSGYQAVFREADNAWIPFDEANCDYLCYEKWCKQGNKLEALDALKPVKADSDIVVAAAVEVVL